MTTQPINDTTPGGLPLPHPANRLEDDVLRLRAALTAMDGHLDGLAQLMAAGATQTELDDAVAALGARIDALTATATFLAGSKVGVVNGLPGPAVTLQPAHLGLGPTNGPSQVNIGRDAQGRVATITETIGALPAATTLTYDAQGRVATVATTYDGRRRTQAITYDANGMASINAVEGAA